MVARMSGPVLVFQIVILLQLKLNFLPCVAGRHYQGVPEPCIRFFIGTFS